MIRSCATSSPRDRMAQIEAGGGEAHRLSQGDEKFVGWLAERAASSVWCGSRHPSLKGLDAQTARPRARTHCSRRRAPEEPCSPPIRSDI